MLSTSSYTYHHFIRRYIVFKFSEKALLNKLQKPNKQILVSSQLHCTDLFIIHLIENFL
jgi:hypothetical protein